jgi:hypothetical protein
MSRLPLNCLCLQRQSKTLTLHTVYITLVNYCATTVLKHNRYRCALGAAVGDALFTDCNIHIAAPLPPEMTAATADSAITGNSSSSCVVRILTPSKEQCDPDNSAFLSFYAAEDCVLFVCVDTRLVPGKLPNWLSQNGFRLLPESVTVVTAAPALKLRVLRRFVRGCTRLQLGGSGSSSSGGDMFGSKQHHPPLLRHYALIACSVPR